ncbi:thioesterase II family protein [Microtetraspora niveoalba]|uniref:thioesterase II family protein n=1 Tax=Microtetraspora niveoalba TaxID=46175 RepID=UPI00082CF531|nr:alpha/beta fold hydrolase [Microtetraspora niveoalba]
MTFSGNSADDLWVRRLIPAPDAAARLVCLPHAGGSASYYHPVSRALSPAVEVLAVQYPGRQDRRGEPFVEDIATLADRVHEALRPWTDRPLALFGHSMGAVLAFEVTLRMEREGVRPLALYASGRRAPSTHRAEDVHLRNDAGIISELKKLNGTADSLLDDDELLHMVLPATRADYRAIETYRCEPGAVVRTPIIALTGDDDPKTTLEEARAWSAHTTGGFDLRVFPGGHFFLNDHAHKINMDIRSHLASTAAAGRV